MRLSSCSIKDNTAISIAGSDERPATWELR
jgi:hypothetical protein